ncbi:phosphopantetheine-binding protein [Streptomyces albulus]|nr:phosphopantetheine-binding protein [Streptomyces noursei]
MLPLSARDGERLTAYAARLLAHLRSQQGADVEEVVRDQLAAVLRVRPAEVDPDAGWEDQGVEPVHLAALQNRLHDAARLSIDTAGLLEAGTVRAVAARLRDRSGAPGATLAELAYTFQVGRVAMPERAAFVSRDLAELATQLEAFVRGGKAVPGVHRGTAKDHREVAALFSGDDVYREVVRGWAAQGAHDKLAKSWAAGFDVDWAAGYQGRPPHRVAAPPTRSPGTATGCAPTVPCRGRAPAPRRPRTDSPTPRTWTAPASPRKRSRALTGGSRSPRTRCWSWSARRPCGRSTTRVPTWSRRTWCGPPRWTCRPPPAVACGCTSCWCRRRTARSPSRSPVNPPTARPTPSRTARAPSSTTAAPRTTRRARTTPTAPTCSSPSTGTPSPRR